MERSTKERIEGPGPSEEGITNMYRCRGVYEKRRRKRNGERIRTGVWGGVESSVCPSRCPNNRDPSVVVDACR